MDGTNFILSGILQSYNLKGNKIDEDIYEHKGFQVRFFASEQVEKLAVSFKVLEVKEVVETSKALYLVSCKKTKSLPPG